MLAPQYQGAVSDSSVTINLYPVSAGQRQRHGPILHYYIIVVADRLTSKHSPKDFNIDTVQALSFFLYHFYSLDYYCLNSKHSITFLPLDQAIASKRVFVIVSGSDGRAGGNAFGAS